MRNSIFSILLALASPALLAQVGTREDDAEVESQEASSESTFDPFTIFSETADFIANDEEPNAACWQFDGQPRRCENNGCFYNYRTNRCREGGGGGGRNFFVCSARDRGYEEHWGAHEGRGRTRREAENQAVRECQRYHGRCQVSNCTVRQG